MKCRRNDSRGVALVVVLAMSALMVVLVTGLLTFSSSELSASRCDEEGLRSRTLADSAINLAISQLRLGTSPAARGSPPWAWTSQPGAIRVHDSHGRLERLYKLYSSDQMSAGSLSELADQLEGARRRICRPERADPHG
jgi:type II secretory pathway component PulK